MATKLGMARVRQAASIGGRFAYNVQGIVQTEAGLEANGDLSPVEPEMRSDEQSWVQIAGMIAFALACQHPGWTEEGVIEAAEQYLGQFVPRSALEAAFSRRKW